jgi:ABC-type glycerol-3-phosphate transport system permease component
VDLNKKQFKPYIINRGKGVDGPVAQIVIGMITLVIIIFAILPILITINSSLKSNYEMALGIFRLPASPRWHNWLIGLQGLGINLLNSIVVCLVSTIGIVLLSSVVAYVFTRHSFPGKEIIFSAIVALMIVPGVLTLTPSYLLIMNLNLKNTWWSLILPYISGGQIGAIFLFRTFLSQQPLELFEAARIDGASDFAMYTRIAIPLAIPILTIQAVSSFGALYNDFLWPTLVIDNQTRQTLMPVLRTLTAQVRGVYNEQGIMHSMFLISGLPLIVTTALGLKYFINGEFASGLKL